MALSPSRLRFRDGQKTRSAELYTAAADWANTGTPSPKTMRVVAADGTTLYVGVDSIKTFKHRNAFAKRATLKVCPGHDSVFTNGDFEAALSGWSASSAGFSIARSTVQVLFGLASGVLHKEPSKETGAYIDHAFTIAAADRDGKLFIYFDYRSEKGYIDRLFQVQVMRAASVVAQAAIEKTHEGLRLEWTGDGTATYTLRFKVNTDEDDERPLEVDRELVIDNIYAGPLLQYNVARRLLVTKDDPTDDLEDRVTSYDVQDEGAPSIPANTDRDVYEKEINFDFDTIFTMHGIAGGDDLSNLYIAGGMVGLDNDIEIFIDSVSQGTGYIFRRLAGKHTIKLTAHNRSLFFEHNADYKVWAMTQTEVMT